MGYSTDFTGKLKVTPPMDAQTVANINDFMDRRHGGPRDPDPGCPGFWCNWQASDDGKFLFWNGNEKTYDFPEWLEILIKRYLKGHKVNGRLLAQGENNSDIWTLTVRDSKVTTEAYDLPDFGVTTFEDED